MRNAYENIVDSNKQSVSLQLSTSNFGDGLRHFVFDSYIFLLRSYCYTKQLGTPTLI